MEQEFHSDLVDIKKEKLEKNEELKIEQEYHSEFIFVKEEKLEEFENEWNTLSIIKDEVFNPSVLMEKRQIKSEIPDDNEPERAYVEEKPYKCNISDKKLIQQKSVVTRKKIHSGEKLYRCDICDKTFNRRSSLIRHKRVHNGEKPFVCDICDKAFSERSNLVSHKRIHSGEKPFSCDFCDETFTHRNSFIRHNLIHTGEKKTRNRLESHKRSIHNTEKQPLYEVLVEAFSSDALEGQPFFPE
ncbi:zinc finger protein 583-like [Chrysoperla carnea]|uniref:zinc finger protein 583-like n=1 Tax=Chrysoperla carnea TaxID=189513 RepID=UPI001D079A09|nr:zinc finger protein 583-like [Chrysoperla carnea]